MSEDQRFAELVARLYALSIQLASDRLMDAAKELEIWHSERIDKTEKHAKGSS